MTCQLQNAMVEVVSFHEQHNHEFAYSPIKRKLRLTRHITHAQKAIAEMMLRSLKFQSNKL